MLNPMIPASIIYLQLIIYISKCIVFIFPNKISYCICFGLMTIVDADKMMQMELNKQVTQ